MSRESGMFSIQRKRETLGTISHNVTTLPMPSSALKRTYSQAGLAQAPQTVQHVRSASGSRPSLAPGRPLHFSTQRASSSSNFADLGLATVQRPSTMNLFSGTATRKSIAPIANTPAHPIQLPDGTTARRSSIYSVRPSAAFGLPGHQSFFATAPPANGIPSDPRRLRDSSTRAQMGQELMEFLTQRNFELETKHSLNHKSMTSPTQKDFNMMFQFLYHCIDPSYRFQKNIDVEVPPLLKQLRYPFEKNISKSQLAAVGGNNWPTFLGLLHWMMQLSTMMEQYAQGAYDIACAEAGFDVAPDRITFDFLCSAYREWLSIEDEDDEEEEAKRRIQPHIEVMASKFEEANQANLQQLRALEAEGKALQDQIDELSKTAPRLAKLDAQIKVLEEDRVKFENYNTSMDAKIERYEHRAQLLQQEIERCDQELQAAEDERDDLQRQVDQQGLSVQDIDRMNTERERLQKGVETASARLEEAKDRCQKKETDAGEKLDELETIVQNYNSLGYQIGIIPPAAHHANGFEHELQLTINDGPNFTGQLGTTSQLLESDRLLHDASSGYQPYHILRHADLKASKRALQDLRKTISERRNTISEQDMAKADMLDKTREALEDKHAEMETLGHRLRAAQEEFEKMREITTAQNMGSDTQIERMEKELARIRAGVTESVQYMEQREMNTNLEYEQLTARSASLREELHTELEKMLNDIIKFKIHVQESLLSYEELVATEIEQEYAEQDAEQPETNETVADEEEVME